MSEVVTLTISTVIRPAVPPPTALGDLTDVMTEGVVAQQVLKYDGESWAPAADDQGTGGVTVVDNLASNSATSALSANQGRALKQLVDTKANISSLPTYTTAASLPSDLSGYVNGSEIVVTG